MEPKNPDEGLLEKDIEPEDQLEEFEDVDGYDYGDDPYDDDDDDYAEGLEEYMEDMGDPADGDYDPALEGDR